MEFNMCTCEVVKGLGFNGALTYWLIQPLRAYLHLLFSYRMNL